MAGHKFYDVWFVQRNEVYKEVPFQVVTDWVQQARLAADDMVKPSASPNWTKVSELVLFEPYLPRPEPVKGGDEAVAYEPLELDFHWRKRNEDEDDDVDMIPLIDISLVLLIYFMMTATVASISRIVVPSMVHAVKIDTEGDIIRLDIDKSGTGAIYGIGRKNDAPPPGFADLTGDDALFNDNNQFLVAIETFRQPDQPGQAEKPPPKVRVAAHGDLPYSVVEKVMKRLDRYRDEGKIANYHIEVNERVGP